MHAAARDILSNAKTKVMGGLALSADDGGNGASAAHYALAALELLCADGHAVPLERMHDVIGAAAANALVQDDLLAFQDAAPLGSRVEGRLFDGGAVVKCSRAACTTPTPSAAACTRAQRHRKPRAAAS